MPDPYRVCCSEALIYAAMIGLMIWCLYAQRRMPFSHQAVMHKKTGVPDDLPPNLWKGKERRQGDDQGGHPGPRQSA